MDMDMDVEQYNSGAVTVSTFENAPNLFDAVFAINSPPPPHFLIAFFGGYMPHKSTISHLGDIFVHPKTMRCKRDLNAFYGHSSATPFLGFANNKCSKIYNNNPQNSDFNILLMEVL